MINLTISFLVGVAIAWVTSLIYITYWQTEPEKLYHCHGKNFFLMETVIPNSDIYVKTQPEKFCIDIRNIKERGKK